MILKLLLIAIIIGIVYILFFKNKPQSKKEENIDEMVQCKQCNTYIALEDAILSQGKYYCSAECLQKDTQ